jgi:hypothetical protein
LRHLFANARDLFAVADYRRMWAIGAFCGVARWLEFVAIAIFAYELTHSPERVALLAVLRMLPYVLLGFGMGGLAEHRGNLCPDRRELSGLSDARRARVTAGSCAVPAARAAVTRFGLLLPLRHHRMPRTNITIMPSMAMRRMAADRESGRARYRAVINGQVVPIETMLSLRSGD